MGKRKIGPPKAYPGIEVGKGNTLKRILRTLSSFRERQSNKHGAKKPRAREGEL